jgi:hypothetical protein
MLRRAATIATGLALMASLGLAGAGTAATPEVHIESGAVRSALDLGACDHSSTSCTYNYRSTAGIEVTMTLNSDFTVVFSAGCTGVWTVTGKAFAYEVPTSGQCGEQVGAAKVKTVLVGGVTKIKLANGTGTVLGSPPGTYTWSAVQQ